MGCGDVTTETNGRDERAGSLTPYLCLAAILLIAAGLRLYRLAAESLWFDETYSVAFAQRSLRDFSPFRLEGPPFTDRNLYHLLLHFWLTLGRGDFFVRLLSATLGAGCILVIHSLATELFDAKAALWSALLLAISPFHVWYSQEVRMYILVSLLTLLSAYSSLRVLNTDGQCTRGHFWGIWTGYVLCTAMALYTHFFAVFIVLAQNVFVAYLVLSGRISRRVVKGWLLAQISVLISIIPLLRGLILQQQKGWWNGVRS